MAKTEAFTKLVADTTVQIDKHLDIIRQKTALWAKVISIRSGHEFNAQIEHVIKNPKLIGSPDFNAGGVDQQMVDAYKLYKNGDNAIESFGESINQAASDVRKVADKLWDDTLVFQKHVANKKANPLKSGKKSIPLAEAAIKNVSTYLDKIYEGLDLMKEFHVM